MIPREDKESGYTAPKITAPSSGYGQAGSQYSKDMANTSSPSDLGQTRQLDLGDGTYVFQRMDSVTGQWVNLGKPIPYQTNQSGGAIKPENYTNPITTPNGTTVAFGNVEDPVLKYSAPIIMLPTSDKLITENRDYTGAGGQPNIQVGLLSSVKGYEHTPDIGRLADMDKNRYIPAEVALGGGVTGQGYIDLETRMFDYAFKFANIDWNKPGNKNYKPDYGTMKLYSDQGVVSGAMPMGNGYMFGVSIPDPRKISIDNAQIGPSTMRAGLITMPDSIAAIGNTVSPHVQGIIDYTGKIINPSIKANSTAAGGRNWTMEDVNAGRISQHDYMVLSGKTTPIQAFSKYLESKTAGTVYEIPAIAFSMAPMFIAGGGEVGVARMNELGIGEGVLGRAMREGSFDSMLPSGSPLRTENWYTFGKITPPTTSIKTVSAEERALEQWSTMTTGERIISRSVVRDMNAEAELYRIPPTNEPLTTAMPGKYDMISRIVNRDVMAERMAADIRLNYGMEESGSFFTRFEDTGAITMRNAVNHDYLAITPQINMVNHDTKLASSYVESVLPAWAQPHMPTMQHVTVEGTTLKVTSGITAATIGTVGMANITTNANDIISKITPRYDTAYDTAYNEDYRVVPLPKFDYTPRIKPPEPIPDIQPVPIPQPPSFDWKMPNYPFGIPPFLTGGGVGYVDRGRAIGKAYRISILDPFNLNLDQGRKRKAGAKRRKK